MRRLEVHPSLIAARIRMRCSVDVLSTSRFDAAIVYGFGVDVRYIGTS